MKIEENILLLEQQMLQLPVLITYYIYLWTPSYFFHFRICLHSLPFLFKFSVKLLLCNIAIFVQILCKIASMQYFS